MTIEELTQFCASELHIQPQYINERMMLITTPLHQRVAVIGIGEELTIDLRYGTQPPLSEFGLPYRAHGKAWAGIRMDDSYFDELIKTELKRLYEWYVQKEIKTPALKPEIDLDAIRQIQGLKGKDEVDTFLRQAQAMADWRVDMAPDPYEIIPSVCSYNELTEKQLLSYLYERTRVRDEGKYPEDLPGGGFICLYLSEIINGVGFDSIEQAYDRLVSLNADFQISSVLTDFSLLHDLPLDRKIYDFDAMMMHLTASFSEDAQTYLHNLLRYDANDYYQLASSSYYLRDPHRYGTLIYETMQALQKKTSFISYYMAPFVHEIYHPYERLMVKGERWHDHLYVITPVRRFYEEAGKLYYDHYQRPHSLKRFYDVVREIERLARLIDGVKAEADDELIDDDVKKAIHEALLACKQNQKKPPLIYNAALFRRMRQLYKPSLSKAENFIRQGRLLERCVTGVPLAGSRDFPLKADYQKLTSRQLMAYLSWRTDVRRTENIYDIGPYSYLYVSEIINGIGFKNETAALAMFLKIRERSPLDEEMNEAFDDYVMIHQCKRYYHELKVYACTMDYVTLIDEESSAEALMAALRRQQKDFGTHHCLYHGNEKKSDALIADLIHQLVRLSAMRDYLIDFKTVDHPLFGRFIYDETRSEDETITLNRGCSLHYDATLKKWTLTMACFRTHHLHTLDQMITCIIDEHFRIHHAFDRDNPFYLTAKSLLEDALAARPLTIVDTAAAFKSRYAAVYERIRKMRKIKKADAYTTFLAQATFMADVEVEDEAIEKDAYWTNRYVSCFNDMSDYELMVYFHMRSLLRHHQFINASFYRRLMAIFVRELIHDIGCADGENLALLKELRDRYDDVFANRLALYCHDYALVHHIADEEVFLEEKKDDQILLDLDVSNASSSHQFFMTLMKCRMSARYDIRRSMIYKNDPDAYEQMIYDLFSFLRDHHDLPEAYLGQPQIVSYVPFDGLDMYQIRSFKSFSVTPLRRYYDDHHQLYQVYYTHQNISVISDILHECERMLRKKLKINVRLKEVPIDEHLRQTIIDFLSSSDYFS